MLPHSAPPQSPPVPITLSVRTVCLCPYLLTLHQPAAKPVPRKRKGLSRVVPVIHNAKPAIVYTPLDRQPIKELFNQDTADDTITNISTNRHHLLASEDLDYQLDYHPLPLTPTLPHPKNRKRSAHVLGKQGGVSHPKRPKRSEGMLPSDIDVGSSGENPILALSTPSRSLPLVTRPMVSVPP